MHYIVILVDTKYNSLKHSLYFKIIVKEDWFKSLLIILRGSLEVNMKT